MDKIKPFKKEKNDTVVRDLAKDETLRKKMLKKDTSVVSMIVFVIFALLILGMFSPAAVAEDDGDDDGVDDETEEYNERGVHIDSEPFEIELKSVLLSGDTHHEIEIELDSWEEIKIKFEFSKYNNTPEPEIEISVEFREITEFRDNNANGKYDSGDDEVSVYDLREAIYEEIDYTTRTTTDGETEHILTAQTSDGVFRVVVHAVGNFATIESGTLSPSEIKLDIIISNYPYEEEDTQLALFAKLESEEEIEEEHGGSGTGGDDSDDETKVTISAADAEAYFSWAEHADVDGVDTPVLTSTKTEDDGDLNIHFNYKRGDVINHDPKLGVPFLTLSSGHPDSEDDNSGMRAISYLAALVVGGMIIGGAVYWRRKKNGYT